MRGSRDLWKKLNLKIKLSRLRSKVPFRISIDTVDNDAVVSVDVI